VYVDEDGVIGGDCSEDRLWKDRSVNAVRRSEQIRQIKTCSVVDQTEKEAPALSRLYRHVRFEKTFDDF
jgi:hypothetical protein